MHCTLDPFSNPFTPAQPNYFSFIIYKFYTMKFSSIPCIVEWPLEDLQTDNRLFNQQFINSINFTSVMKTAAVKKSNKGGAGLGQGRHRKYAEATKVLTMRIPKSKEHEIRLMVNKFLIASIDQSKAAG